MSNGVQTDNLAQQKHASEQKQNNWQQVKSVELKVTKFLRKSKHSVRQSNDCLLP